MKKSERMHHVLGWGILTLSLLMGSSGCARKEDEFVSLSELEAEAGERDSSAVQDETGSPGSSAALKKTGERDSSAVQDGTGSAGSSAVSKATGEGDLSAEQDETGSPDSSASPDGSGPTDAAEASDSAEASQKAKIYVDVCGAVVNPGVYRLKEGSRVFQAVKRAGGFLPEAAGEYVNQACSLTDGEQIYIPTRAEAEKGSLPEPEGRKKPGGEKEETAHGGGKTSDEERINLNTADLTALMTLNGIGESRARAILEYREEHGGFSSIEEICSVQGIKEGTFGRIKDRIAIE